jgi:hypothetical protein
MVSEVRLDTLVWATECSKYCRRNFMGWGQPKRRTALGLDAEVKITSVSFGSALPAEVDATSAAKQYAKLAEVKSWTPTWGCT